MSFHRNWLGAALSGLALVNPAGRIAAQSEPAQLPAPLVTALLAGNRLMLPSSSARYFVGAPPPGWPAALNPSWPTSVVGGMAAGPQLIAVFADTSRRFLASYLKQLEDSGWVQPVMDRGPGFQSSAFGLYGYFCKDSSRLSAIAVPGAPAGAFIHVTYQRADLAACVNRPPQPRVSALELPTLTPPPDARSIGSGRSAGSDAQDAHVRLTATSLTPAAILAHYIQQLKTAGWTADAPATAGAIAAQALQARDKEGMLWSGSLVVHAAGTEKDVSLSMRRITTP